MRTAVLLPPGCRFSEAQPNSMETVVRTLLDAGSQYEIRVFCSEGGDEPPPPGVVALPRDGRQKPCSRHLKRSNPT